MKYDQSKCYKSFSNQHYPSGDHSRGGTKEGGEHCAAGSFLFVEIQIFGGSKRRVQGNNRRPNQNGQENVERDAGHPQAHNRDYTENAQHRPILERLIEDNQRLFAEEIEGEPGGEDD